MAASRRASNPAATANCVEISHANTTFGSIPNSSEMSKADLRPANCGISLNSVAFSILTEPSLPLISRTKFLSSNLCLYSSETSLIQVSPRTSRSKVSSSNTFSPPGRPRETPVMTYGSALRFAMVSFSALTTVAPCCERFALDNLVKLVLADHCEGTDTIQCAISSAVCALLTSTSKSV